MKGFQLFCSGRAWEKAFSQAIDFQQKGTVLLGPSIGVAGEIWLRDHSFRKNLVLGQRIERWEKWLEGTARSHSLNHGRGFRILNQAAKREYFRKILSILSDTGSFHQLHELWQEEEFFSELLQAVEEARTAGLIDDAAIERAKEKLSSGDDPVTRKTYEDLWNLLMAYEQGIQLQENLDLAKTLALAREAVASEGPPIYLLGFDRMSVLEAEIVQTMAMSRLVVLPLNLSTEQIVAVTQGHDVEMPSANFLRFLLSNYAGKIEILPVPSVSEQKTNLVMSAHIPSEEARAVSKFISMGHCVRVVAPPSFFADTNNQVAFASHLPLPKNFFPAALSDVPVERLFLTCLKIKANDYSHELGLELARTLEITLGTPHLAPLITSLGIRKGLKNWEQKAIEPLRPFVEILNQIDKIVPDKGTALAFSVSLDTLAKKLAVAELARTSPNLSTEREAHLALSAILRNAQLLAVSTDGEFTLKAWIKELETMLGMAPPNYLCVYPEIEVYEFGEWLPEQSDNAYTVILGLNSGIEPRRNFQFYFEESARRKLSELLFDSQVRDDAWTLDYLSRVTQQRCIMSHATHNHIGKEIFPSWVLSSLSIKKENWPDPGPVNQLLTKISSSAVSVPMPEKNLSPTILDTYQECPFKAWVGRVLNLKDKMKEPSLDLLRLDEGSIVHRCLEIYYGQKNGRNLIDQNACRIALDESVQEAVDLQVLQYFKGNDNLLKFQLDRLTRLLWDFLLIDQDQFSKFPQLSKILVEEKVQGSIGESIWTGKVDRIDFDEAQKKFLVYDYKLGASLPSNKEVENLQCFQLPLYMDAIEAKYSGAVGIGGLYASISSGKRNQGLLNKEFNKSKTQSETPYFELHGRNTSLKTPEHFQELREKYRIKAEELAKKIAQGEFPVQPTEEYDPCPSCEYRPVCRIREIRGPLPEPWGSEEFTHIPSLLDGISHMPVEPRRSAVFNAEQEEALQRKDQFVFVEASAGTGKTTVIVEKVRRFLLERIRIEPKHRAVERFAAISFTEKSAQELGMRMSKVFLEDEQLGAQVAAQSVHQVNTIHGFCRKVISEYPIESGISPMAKMLDGKGAELFWEKFSEEFFLDPGESMESLHFLMTEYPRHKVESILRQLIEVSFLQQRDFDLYRSWARGEIAFPSHLMAPESIEEEYIRRFILLAKDIGEKFAEKKRQENVLDFSDLERLALKVLQFSHVQEAYRQKYSLVLVDEFQDTNSVQREIVEKLAQENYRNIFVVGDAKQSIYRFRAADVSVFQSLRKVAENERHLVSLHRNYRSRPVIVEVANEISRKMFAGDRPDYEATASDSVSMREASGSVKIYQYEIGEKESTSKRKEREASILVRLVLELKSQKKTIAILMRKISGNEVYLRALTNAGIQFRVGASKGFYSQPIISDSIALLRAMESRENELAWAALLRSPWIRMPDLQLAQIKKATWDFSEVGNEALARVLSWFDGWSHLGLSKLLKEAYTHYPMGRREYLQTIKFIALVESLEKEGMSLTEIIGHLSQWSGWSAEERGQDDATMPEPQGDSIVWVMTVHAAKGLEFDITILPDLESGLRVDNAPLRTVNGVGIGLARETEDNSDAFKELGKENKKRELAELKRLFYVAITRAKEQEIFLLGKSEEPVEKPQTWADYLRMAHLPMAERITLEESALSRNEIPIFAPRSVPLRLNQRVVAGSFETSISELAAFQFCGEFHRRKFVQAWDDKIVALWPKEKVFPKNSKEKAPKDPHREEVEKLLRKLRIEKKERGIALHRVLERIKNPEADMQGATIWLREAYEAQGVEANSSDFSILLDRDIAVLEKFLFSDLGRELFSPNVTAYPEISFLWKFENSILHGTIDRLIKKDNSWIVVDYKSSILEESLDRYQFQVAAYTAAVTSIAEKGEECNGFLLDLFSAESHPVPFEKETVLAKIQAEIKNVKRNYTLSKDELGFSERGIQPGKHCFHCPYSLHCDLGKRFVLESK